MGKERDHRINGAKEERLVDSGNIDSKDGEQSKYAIE
jgi:hypothetical protein